jgi:hypothetical protein
VAERLRLALERERRLDDKPVRIYGIDRPGYGPVKG